MSTKLWVRGCWIITDADGEARVLGNEHSAVIPGPVNAHHHSHPVAAILHGVSDDLLEPWILAWQGMPAIDPGLDPKTCPV